MVNLLRDVKTMSFSNWSREENEKNINFPSRLNFGLFLTRNTIYQQM